MTSISDTNVVNAPGGLVEVAFQQRTTEYITSSTTVNGASNIFSSNATFIADGSPYIVDFFCGRIITYGPYTNIYLVDGSGNSLGMFGLVYPGDNQVPGFYRYRFVPTAGAVVNLNIRGIVNTTGSASYGAGDGGTGTGNQMPMQLRVSKIIQASQLIVQTPNAPLVTSLPSNAIDGQEVRYLADNTNGIIWNLRYRAGSSSTYKWEFIGGNPLFDFETASVSTTSGSFTSIAGDNLSVPIPLAGDYDVEVHALGSNSAGASYWWLICPSGCSYPTSDQRGIRVVSQSAGAYTTGSHRSRVPLTVGTLTAQYRQAAGGTMIVAERSFTVTPIRVSA